MPHRSHHPDWVKLVLAAAAYLLRQVMRSWVEAVYPDLAYFNEVDRGGHFAAWEEPDLFAAEMRAAFKSLR